MAKCGLRDTCSNRCHSVVAEIVFTLCVCVCGVIMVTYGPGDTCYYHYQVVLSTLTCVYVSVCGFCQDYSHSPAWHSQETLGLQTTLKWRQTVETNAVPGITGVVAVGSHATCCLDYSVLCWFCSLCSWSWRLLIFEFLTSALIFISFCHILWVLWSFGTCVLIVWVPILILICF